MSSCAQGRRPCETAGMREHDASVGCTRGTLTQASDWSERLRSTGGMEVACRMSA